MHVVMRSMKNVARRHIERQRLSKIAHRHCDVSNLPEFPQVLSRATPAVECFTAAGAVNPGDQQAIAQLAKGKQNALEVGTHLGGSTMMIAAGAQRLTTVDMINVNGREGAWVTARQQRPIDRLEAANLAHKVKFVVADSVEFLRKCQEVFDFIFLDGSHAAEVVYQEVPLALNVLAPGGCLLLHDVFPEQKPLWADGLVIPGPWLALKRLQNEGALFRINPLGELPWPTKQGSRVTSLALLSR